MDEVLGNHQRTHQKYEGTNDERQYKVHWLKCGDRASEPNSSPEAFLEQSLGGSLVYLRAKYGPYEAETPNT